VFQRVTINPFFQKELKAQEQRILRSSVVQALLRHGEFYRKEDATLEFMALPKNVARPIENYPHTKDDNLEGCVTITEQPYKDARGNIPKYLYKVVFDPYYKEESEDVSSLFCCYVMKMYNNLDPVNEGLPVAWYRGRPQDLDRAYGVLFDLAEYYDCDVQGEIPGGGQGVIDYAKANRLTHKLSFDLELINNKEVNKQSNRTYLMNMPTERKRMGLTYVIDWHKNLRSVDDKGVRTLTLHRYYDIVGIREMRKFNGKRNADTISTLIVAMFELKEQVYQAEKQQEKEKKEDFYSRPLFSSEASGTTTNY
jgi:hypothetical protein